MSRFYSLMVWILAGVLTVFTGTLLSSCGCLFGGGSGMFLFPGKEPLQETVVAGEGRDKILLIDINGLIIFEERAAPLQFDKKEGTVPLLKEELQKALEDTRVKAVVLRIDSPGGTVTASDVIYHELVSFKRETGIPIIASFQDIAASGGYYIAMAADRIVAHPTTITGSIGVIMRTFNLEGLLEKIGVEDRSVKSGPKKDLGSPFRDWSKEEKEILQGVIDSLQKQFLWTVRQGRPRLSSEKISALADGRIFTARQALEHGLIDKIGYLEDAIEEAKKVGGLEKARVVSYHRPNQYRKTIYSGTESYSAGALPFINSNLDNLMNRIGPRFLYLWVPHPVH